MNDNFLKPDEINIPIQSKADQIPNVQLPEQAPVIVKATTENDFWKADQRGVIDKILGKFSSRKLLVFVVATIAFFIKLLPAEYWTYIAVAYIGSQTVVDLFTKAGSVGGAVKSVTSSMSSGSSIPNLFSFGNNSSKPTEIKKENPIIASVVQVTDKPQNRPPEI
jgi:hypothetical protein